MFKISHDIRTPLLSVLEHMKLLKERKEEVPPDMKILDHISHTIHHILLLVNNLLEFHSSNLNEIPSPVLKPFNPSVLFNDIYESFKPLANSRMLELNYHSPDINDPVYNRLYIGDPVRIRQCVENLMSNAIKFTSKGKIDLFVRLLSEDEKSYSLHVIVKDEGPGIPEDKIEYVFQEFARLEGSQVAEGFGLGLSITYNLLKQMEGKITCENSVEGGCKFSITLPLTLENQIKEPEKVKNRLDREIRCLFVDDDPFQLKLYEYIGLISSFQVKVCREPEEVTDLLFTQSFDIIFTDIHMPVMNGCSLLKRIRTSGAYKARFIPVVAISGDERTKNNPEEAYHFSGFLNKGFTKEDFIKMVNQVCIHNLYGDTEVNIASLIAFTGNDPEEIRDTLQVFIQSARTDIDKLNQYLSDRNKKEVRSICHRLSSQLNLVTNRKSFWYLDKMLKDEQKLSDQEWEEVVAETIHILTIIVGRIEASEYFK